MSAELRTRRLLHLLGGNYRSYLILLNCFKHSREFTFCGKGLKGYQKHKKKVPALSLTPFAYFVLLSKEPIRLLQNASEPQAFK